jgi:hypothetical protein
MIASIIGCGQTAQLWNGEGYSIGVNDCWKYGIITDRLIVVNSLNKWPERRKVVLNSTPKDGLYSMISNFVHHPNYKHIGSMQRWKGNYKPGILYNSITSPFISLSMAHNIGYKEIVLWGVDLVDHPNVKGYSLNREVMQFDTFCKSLLKEGTKVYLGSEFGALKEILPVWK